MFFIRFLFEVNSLIYNSFWKRFLIFMFNLRCRIRLLLLAWRYKTSTAAIPGKPGSYPWRSPPFWAFRAVMGWASWCVTLIVILVQLVNLNAVKRVSALRLSRIFGCSRD